MIEQIERRSAIARKANRRASRRAGRTGCRCGRRGNPRPRLLPPSPKRSIIGELARLILGVPLVVEPSFRHLRGTEPNDVTDLIYGEDRVA
jgi:hypothetical protein